MKQSQILSLVLAGELIQCGEYLMAKADTIRYTKNGKAESFTVLRHTILTPGGAVTVDEDTRNLQNFDPATYKSPFKKGEQIAVIVTSKIIDKGVVTIRGTISRVEA